MVNDSRLCAAPRTSTLRASHVTGDSTVQTTAAKSAAATSTAAKSAAMAAALSAELDGEVPIELMAEIVRSVLDDARLATLNRAEGAAMIEARLRIERFIRARTPGVRTPIASAPR